MENSKNPLYIKIASFMLCILFIIIICLQPLAVPAKAIVIESIAGGLIASICFSMAATLGTKLIVDSVDTITRNWDNFCAGLESAGEDLADKWTATYNNGILKLSDSLYNVIYHFLDDYNGINGMKLVKSEYISKITVNNHECDIYDFDTFLNAQNYIESHREDFYKLTSGTYGMASSVTFSLKINSNNSVNLLSYDNLCFFTGNTLKEQYQISHSGVFPQKTVTSTDSRFYFFTIGKILYLYLYSVWNGSVSEFYVNSKENPELIPWALGESSAIYGPLAPPITGDIVENKNVFIPVHTNSLDGISIDDDVSSAQLTDLQTALYNPAQVGTADGTLVQADSAVNDITATMDASIVTSFEYSVPGLSDVFPFCIPFDIYSIFTGFEVDREAPEISIPIKSDIVGIDTTIDIDFSDWETVAQILRTLEVIAFAVGLGFITYKMIKW